MSPSTSDLLDRLKDDYLVLNKLDLGLSLLLVLVWVVFCVCYFSRVVGLLLSFLLTRYLRFHRIDGFVSIGAISISPVAGKLMFRGVTYACEDFSIRINDGFVVFAYWTFLGDKSATSRISLNISGAQWHIFNQMSKYRELARLLRVSSVLPEEQHRERVKQDKPLLLSLYSLLGVIRVHVSSGKVVFANHLLPYMCVVNCEEIDGKITLDVSAFDHAVMNANAVADNVRVTLMVCPTYKGPRVSEPPRLMGDGFLLLQSSEITLFYFEDQLGLERDAVQQPDVHRPLWESIWRLGRNTHLAYGPWAEEQRALLVSFFLPPVHNVIPITKWPKTGEQRIHVCHEMRVTLLNEASLDIWFLRANELESLHTLLRPGSSLDTLIYWTCGEDGFKWTTKGSLLNMESSTSLIYSPLFVCETFSFEAVAHYPRAVIGRQRWDLSCVASKASLVFVAEHVSFFSDLSREWAGESVPDLLSFVPYTLTVNIQVQEFEVIVLVNESNWVDQDDNWRAAIVGQHLSLTVTFPFDVFAPELVRLAYDIRARGEVALRLNHPPERVSSALYAALASSSPPLNASPSPFGRVSKGADWTEIWRTEGVSISMEYAYHPVGGRFVSEIPSEATSQWLPPEATHPLQLSADIITVHINVLSSEVVLSGIVIRLVKNFVENYCSSYNKMTGVSTTPSPTPPPSPPQPTGSPYHFRPMRVLFAIKLHHIRAFCIGHSLDSTNSVQIVCEVIEVEVDKGTAESLIQVSVSPCVLSMGESTCPTGFVWLSSLQVRGHALFSALDVPWHLASVEYGWTLQILVGTLTGHISAAQLVQLVEMVDSLVAFLTPDDDKTVPAKLLICQHGETTASCPKKTDGACPSDADLQFRLMRMAVDRVSLLIREENILLSTTVDAIRVLYCNGDHRHVSSSISHLDVRLLVPQDNIFLDSSSLQVNTIELNFRLPEANAERWERDRKTFAMKHDDETKRLTFLWRADEGCACQGNFFFFGGPDEVGRFWKLAREQAIPHFGGMGEQLGYMESVLRRGEKACRSESKVVYMRKMMSTDAPSLSSFESFASEKKHAEKYTTLLSAFSVRIPGEEVPELGLAGDVQDWIKTHRLVVDKIRDGVDRVKLTTPEHLPNPSTQHPSSSVISIAGQLAQSIEVHISPWGLDGCEQLMESIFRMARKIRSSYAIQRVYSSCARGAHRQPITRPLLAPPKDVLDLSVNVCLPRVDVSLLVCEASSACLLLSIQQTVLSTKRDPLRTKFTMNCSSITGQIFSLDDEPRTYPPVRVDALHASTEWGDIRHRVLFELHLPSPSIAVDVGRATGDMHIVQIDVPELAGVFLVIDGCPLYTLLAPAVHTLTQSVGGLIGSVQQMASDLTAFDEWRIAHQLCRTPHDEGKAGRYEMSKVRANQTFASCPSCHLCLMLLRYPWEPHDMPSGVASSIRHSALIEALSEWQPLLSLHIQLPADLDTSPFEMDGDRARQLVPTESRPVQASDLYHYILRAHRDRKENSKKKKTAHANGLHFLPHVFFYSFYQKLGLDGSAMDMMQSMRVKMKCSTKSMALNVFEHRLTSSVSLTYVSHTTHCMLSLSQLTCCVDISVDVSMCPRLLLPQKAHLFLRTDFSVETIRFLFAMSSIHLVHDLIMLFNDGIESYPKKKPRKDETSIPKWVEPLLKSETTSQSRRKKPVFEKTLTGSGALDEVRIESRLFDLCASLVIQNTKTQMELKEKFSLEAVSRKTIIALINMQNKESTHIAAITILDSRIAFLAEAQRTVTVAIASIDGEIIQSIADVQNTVEKCIGEVGDHLEHVVTSKQKDGDHLEHVVTKQKESQTRSADSMTWKATVNSFELLVNLASSLTAKLRIEKARADGRIGNTTRGMIRIEDHWLLLSHRRGDHLRMTLPKCTLVGVFKEHLQHVDIFLAIDSFCHVFSTDSLNLVLFIEIVIRAELNKLVEKMTRSKKWTPSSRVVSLRVEGKGEPWMSLTAHTPTGTAVQLRMHHLIASLNKSGEDRVLGNAQLQVELRLGQLSLNQIEEQFAGFSTVVSLERKDGQSTDSFVVMLCRPIASLQPRGVERAILLLLHCKTSFDHWCSSRVMPPIFPPRAPASSRHIMHISLSLVVDSLQLRVPLRADSCVLVVLQKADVNLCVKGELAVQASFNAFKVTIVENETDSMADLYSPTDPRSNLVFFPQGALELCSKTWNAPSERAELIVSVRSEMSGVVIDLDHRIGRLAKLLVSSFSSIGQDDASDSVPSISSSVSSDTEALEAINRDLDRFSSVDDKLNFLDSQIQAQSTLVNDLVHWNASNNKIEEERKILRRFELARLKHFKKSMIGRLRRDDSNSINEKILRMEVNAQLTIHSGRCTLRTARVSERRAVCTQLDIPEVSLKGVYWSGLKGDRGKVVFRVCLAATPSDTLLTPHIADFVEQVLDPLPSLFLRGDSDGDVFIDTSSIPFDVILHLSVQSSTIRFNGQQQRTSAADCLLTLPRLSLLASLCQLADGRVRLHVSATLSAFSLSIYSPHQQSSSHDALFVSLDHLAFLFSRSKNSSIEPDNRVELVMTLSVGSASFNYDMRRLSELVAFPKPWYRPSIARRLVFGDRYMRTHKDDIKITPITKEKTWRTKVVAGVKWKELEVKAQMANTMGNCSWLIVNGQCSSTVEMTSESDARATGSFSIQHSHITSQGGAISGNVSLHNLLCSVHHLRSRTMAPVNQVSMSLDLISMSLEWMSRCILLAHYTYPSINIVDSWTSEKDNSGQGTNESAVTIDAQVKWKDLQLVITKVTTEDIKKMAKKLESFFKEQLKSSKMVWEMSVRELDNDSDKVEEDKNWMGVLDTLTSLQFDKGILPIPSGKDGLTVACSAINIVAESASLACMNGDMTASSWALFHVVSPTVLFSTKASFVFLDSGLALSNKQLLVIKLGKARSGERQATICRVQSRGMRQGASVEERVDDVIGDALRQLGICKKTEKTMHSVLELFQLPALEAALETTHEHPTERPTEPDSEDKQQVVASFTCHFYNSVNVQTDFTAQLSFLPELIKTYMTKDEENVPETPKDPRIYRCVQWIVEPKIGFIDRFKWNPPVIDEVLRKLQIFDHRTTIPKALQRGVLDPLNSIAIFSFRQILKIAQESTNVNQT